MVLRSFFSMRAFAPPVQEGRWIISYSRAKTQIEPPSGTGGYSPGKPRLRVDCIPAESPPQPETTATYCFPSTRKVVGGARMPDGVGASQRSFPLEALNA